MIVRQVIKKPELIVWSKQIWDQIRTQLLISILRLKTNVVLMVWVSLSLNFDFDILYAMNATHWMALKCIERHWTQQPFTQCIHSAGLSMRTIALSFLFIPIPYLISNLVNNLFIYLYLFYEYVFSFPIIWNQFLVKFKNN
jgi:hypothetical protein